MRKGPNSVISIDSGARHTQGRGPWPQPPAGTAVPARRVPENQYQEPRLLAQFVLGDGVRKVAQRERLAEADVEGVLRRELILRGAGARAMRRAA